MENQMNEQQLVADSPPSLGWFGRVGNIFWEPRKVFEELNLKPSWILPWILISIFSLIALQLTWTQNMEAQMEKMRKQPGMTEEQMESIEEKMGDPQGWGINRIIATTMVPLGTLVAMVVVAAAFYFMGSVIGGGNSTFKKNLAISCYSSLVALPSSIVNAILINLKGSADISLSPVLFMPLSLSDTFTYSFLSHFEFFAIWSFILASIGFSVIYKFSAAKSYLSVGVLWVVWMLLASALSNLFGGFIM